METRVMVLSLLEFRDMHYLMLESVMPEGQLVRLQFSSKNLNEGKGKLEADFLLEKEEVKGMSLARLN